MFLYIYLKPDLKKQVTPATIKTGEKGCTAETWVEIMIKSKYNELMYKQNNSNVWNVEYCVLQIIFYIITFFFRVDLSFE